MFVFSDFKKEEPTFLPLKPRVDEGGCEKEGKIKVRFLVLEPKWPGSETWTLKDGSEPVPSSGSASCSLSYLGTLRLVP